MVVFTTYKTAWYVVYVNMGTNQPPTGNHNVLFQRAWRISNGPVDLDAAIREVTGFEVGVKKIMLDILDAVCHNLHWS